MLNLIKQKKGKSKKERDRERADTQQQQQHTMTGEMDNERGNGTLSFIIMPEKFRNSIIRSNPLITFYSFCQLGSGRDFV